MNREEFIDFVLDYGFHKRKIEQYNSYLNSLETYRRDESEKENSYVVSFYFKNTKIFDGVLAKNTHNTFSEFIISDEYEHSISGTKREMSKLLKELINDGHVIYGNVDAKLAKFSKMLSEIKKFYLSEIECSKKELSKLRQVFKTVEIGEKTILKLHDIFNTTI